MNWEARQGPRTDDPPSQNQLRRAGGLGLGEQILRVTIAVIGLLCRFKLVGAGFWPWKRLLDIRLSGAHIIASRVDSVESSGCSAVSGRNWSVCETRQV